MSNGYKYNAFISYRHISPDKEIAEKLQKKLENYVPPKAFRDTKNKDKWRIFRDETELPTSSNLSKDIKKALEDSEFLIVVCSKETKKSRWCMEEIAYFKEIHNGSNANIITLVADGDPKDIFPESLCNEVIPVTDEKGITTYQNHIIEPLAANVSGKNLKESLRKLNTEFLRIAAPLLGCGYDNLYNREHKKRVRRIFAVGGMIIGLSLLFATYTGAMLWEINNQREALAIANEDLQKKTEELNLSNESLKRSNEELAEKTQEAEENLAEAEKQKKVAEENLAEAEKQRKKAEQNLAEANRQKKIAEENLAEANRQKTIAEENAREAQEQRRIAEENMNEANNQRLIAEENAREAQEQRRIAEENLAEANRQKGIAEANEKEANTQRGIAEENLAEANRQKSIAEANEQEANTQRGIAEENMKIAQENEAKANEQTRIAQIENVKSLMFLSQNNWKNGEKLSAIENATNAVKLADGQGYSTGAMNNLAQYIGAFKQQVFLPTVRLSHKHPVEQIGYAGEGKSLVTQDASGVYLWDAKTGDLKKKYDKLSEYDSPKLYFEDEGIVEETFVYDQNLGVFSSDERGVLGYAKRNVDEKSLCGSDFFIEYSDSFVKVDGVTGKILWKMNSEDYLITNYSVIDDYIVDSVFSYDYSRSYVALHNKEDGVIYAKYELDAGYKFDEFGKWVSFTDDKCYWYQGFVGNAEIVAFDIKDGRITNPKKLIELQSDFSAQLLSYEETENDIITLIRTSDSLFFTRKTISVFDKNTAELRFEYSFSDEYSGFTKMGVIDSLDSNSFCDFLFLVSGKKVLLFNFDTGELLHEYFLDGSAVNTYYSKAGIIHIVTNAGTEIAIGLRNREGSEDFKGDYIGKFVLREFDSKPELCGYFNNSYAISTENSSEVYIYEEIENRDFVELFKNQTSNRKLVINDQGSYALIMAYDYGDEINDKIVVADLSDNSVFTLLENRDSYTEEFGFINEKTVFVSTNNKTEIYDVETGNKLNIYDFGVKELYDKQKVNDKIFAQISNSIVVFDEENHTVFSCEDGSLESFCVSEQNQIACFVEMYNWNKTNYKVTIYDIEKNQNIDINIDGISETNKVIDFNWSSDGKLVVCLENGEIYTFDGNTGDCESLINPNIAHPSELILIENKNCYAVVCGNSKIYVIESQTGKILNEIVTEYTEYETESLIWKFADEKTLIISSKNGGKGYLIDTDNFNVKYFIEDFADYNAKKNTVLVDEFGTIGYYPIYSAKELVEKAESYINK